MGAGATIAPGTVFAGDYEVERTLAAGGMGAVYVARQRSTQKLRALKTLLPEYVSDPTMRARFAREATVGSQIESDHVVEVLAAGVDEPSGVPWIVMELLAGDDLAGVVKKRGSLTPPEVVEAFRQLGHALTAAHRAGVVHRDLKPENLFLARGGPDGVFPKVLDFGIARITHAQATRHTTSAMGSPLWMAPEQTDSTQPITPATDVWALGLIAFWVFTGTHYWLTPRQPEATIGTMIRELLADPLPRASERAAAFGVAERLPPGFDAWFARCVERDQTRRFANAGEAVPALLGLLGGAPLPRRPPCRIRAPPTYAATNPGLAPPTTPRSPRPPPRTRAPSLAAAGGPPRAAPDGAAARAAAFRRPRWSPGSRSSPRRWWARWPMRCARATSRTRLVVAAATPDAALEPDAPPIGSSPEEPVRDPVTGLALARAADGDAAAARARRRDRVRAGPRRRARAGAAAADDDRATAHDGRTAARAYAGGPPPPSVVPPPTMVEPPPVLHAPDAAAPTPPPETPAERGCGRHGNCSSCLGESGCGWCHNLNRCVAGHWGPRPGGRPCSGSNWVHEAAQCDDRCARRRDCSACVSESGCGWCHNLNRCVAGHRGPRRHPRRVPGRPLGARRRPLRRPLRRPPRLRLVPRGEQLRLVRQHPPLRRRALGARRRPRRVRERRLDREREQLPLNA